MRERMTVWDQVLDLAKDRYGTTGDHPFPRDGITTVLRHDDNRKWYGIMMRISREKLRRGSDFTDVEREDGIGTLPEEDFTEAHRGEFVPEEDFTEAHRGEFVPDEDSSETHGCELMPEEDFSEEISILNVKCDPILGGELALQPGFRPAYHMNHTGWLTIFLDGSVAMEQIASLLDMSYGLTASSRTLEKSRKPRNWLVPANPKYYDVIGAFEKNEVIRWKQSSDVRVGDIVYLYVAAPWSAILYRCRAEEVNIPYDEPGNRLNIRRLMRIRRLHRYAPDRFCREVLADYGVTTVRGPRSLPPALLEELENGQETGK